MSLTQRLRFTGSRIADHRIHRRPHEDAGQSIPLLASERVKLRRRRQTSGEPASLDLEVLRGVVVRLAFVLAIVFPLAIAPVPAALVLATGSAAPSCMGHCNLPLRVPTKSAMVSDGNQPPIPRQASRVFRREPVRLAARSSEREIWLS
jgi:hypothetical protein